MRLTARARLTVLLTALVLAAGGALTALTYLLIQRNLRHRSFFIDLDPVGSLPPGTPSRRHHRHRNCAISPTGWRPTPCPRC